MNRMVTTALVVFGLFTSAFAQEEESQVDPEVVTEEQVPEKKESFQRIKVDGVASVVGDYVILESDIDKMILDLKAQGAPMENVTRCNILGKLMEDKLYAHHAIQDSLEIDDGRINSVVDQLLEYFSSQLGSIDNVVEYYNKESEEELRKELFDIKRLEALASQMQSKVIDDIEITPEEVRQFFNKIPEDERPLFGAEMEIAQIVIKPEISEEAKQKVIEDLKGYRKDVIENGASFATKAILYSQDPGSRPKGGKYTLYRKRPQMVKEFRDVAFSLQEGEISEPFETEYGWHILLVEKIRGQEIDIRHIIRIPEIGDKELQEAKEEINTIRQRIVDGEISFEEAAREASDEKETRNSGGQLFNPTTLDTRFELTKMDPILYSQVRNLKDDQVSYPLIDEERDGRKKYKILKVTNRYEEHIADFSQDYIKIKELALKEKKLKAIQKWMVEKIKDTYISVNEDNRDCEFSNNWLKK
ncbi:peptidylprolyl isomerase [Sungkyunkwania multivorans]|uniref:Peptidylprolyl isomerase n=1 Tax=Sungkyunkwania multivorans TaxID=1173618 RepID=A0ABW3CVL4_9FLAO